MEILSDAKSKSSFRLVFVGGSPRSGTTLVQRLLDSHSDIAGGPELNSLQEITHLYENMVKRIDDKRINFYFNKTELKAIFRDFIDSLFRIVHERHNVKIISEKTPPNVLAFETLSEIVDDAFFIFVVRDPKDIVASLKKVRKRALEKKQSVPAHVKNLFLSVDCVYEHFKAGFSFYEKNKDKTFIVKYEDLVNNPGKTAKDIVDFLGLPLENGMLELDGLGTSYMQERAANVDSVFYTKEEVAAKAIEGSSIGRWKKALNKYHAGFVDLAIKDITAQSDEKIYNGRILFALYRIHRALMKTGNIFGKLYQKAILSARF
ncbi:MAG: sulfotransferase [Desulfobacterales bacterium]|nr:sulfotransferase [Desulfobacterales bacterium]